MTPVIDKNGVAIRYGDKVLVHRHDPSQAGEICRYDYTFTVTTDEDWAELVCANESMLFGQRHIFRGLAADYYEVIT